VGEVAVGREEQQSCRVHIEPTHRNPAPLAWRGQTLEDRRTASWITAGRDLADGLVIEEYLAAGGRLGCQLELPAIEAYLVGGRSAVAEPGQAAADRYAPGADPTLDRAARAKASLRKKLLQSDHAIIATKS
jgi:hypothetical protein